MAISFTADPPELPRPRWARFVRRLALAVKFDHVFMSAGAMAFFGFLALLLMLAAAVSFVGLFVESEEAHAQLARFTGLLLPEGAALVEQQLQEPAVQKAQTLGIGLLVSLAIALWGAANGAARLIEALHLVYDGQEERGFWRVRGVALLVALGAIVALSCLVLSLLVLPRAVAVLPIFEDQLEYVQWLRWPLAALVITAFLSFVYRFAPSRPLSRWRRVTWGSLVATLLWLGASWGLSLYVEQADRLQETYGALGGGVAVLLWLYAGGLSVLLGAEVDATVAWSGQGYRVSEREGLGRTARRPYASV